jgi:hypothetical protein
MNGRPTRWVLVLGILLLASLPIQAQERSGWSQGPEKFVSLSEFIVPAQIPPEWGTLRNALPLAGNPAFYALFFEDARGTIRVVPLHLSLVAGAWRLADIDHPVAVIKRGP